MIYVKEVIHHGDFRHEQIHALETLDFPDVQQMMRSSAYTYVPNEDHVSMTLDRLRDNGEAHHGWSRYAVVESFSRPVTITITAVVDGSVTDEQLDWVAAAAHVQVAEPVLDQESDGRPTFGVINYVKTTWTTGS